MVDDLPETIGWVKREGGFLFSVVSDFTIWQRFLQLVNLCLVEVGVVVEIQHP